MYFMAIFTLSQAQGISEPFAYQDYRKKKIRQKIEEDRVDRVKPKYKLPSVNKDLANKILTNDDSVSSIDIIETIGIESLTANFGS